MLGLQPPNHLKPYWANCKSLVSILLHTTRFDWTFGWIIRLTCARLDNQPVLCVLGTVKMLWYSCEVECYCDDVRCVMFGIFAPNWCLDFVLMFPYLVLTILIIVYSVLFHHYLVGGLEHFSIYWEESSQLTFIFFRGVAKNHQPVMFMCTFTLEYIATFSQVTQGWRVGGWCLYCPICHGFATRVGLSSRRLLGPSPEKSYGWDRLV